MVAKKSSIAKPQATTTTTKTTASQSTGLNRAERRRIKKQLKLQQDNEAAALTTMAALAAEYKDDDDDDDDDTPATSTPTPIKTPSKYAKEAKESIVNKSTPVIEVAPKPKEKVADVVAVNSTTIAPEIIARPKRKYNKKKKDTSTIGQYDQEEEENDALQISTFLSTLPERKNAVVSDYYVSRRHYSRSDVRVLFSMIGYSVIKGCVWISITFNR